ncbi:hypothetical protein SprV_0401638300 [Sparganum proliferum]
MNLSVTACDKFDLVINTEQIVVMHQPPPDAAYISPKINVKGTQLQGVDNFTYLGSILFRNTKIDDGRQPSLRPSAKHSLDCLRHILKLRCRDRISYTDVLERAGILSIYAMRWSGHLMRMHDQRLPKRLFDGDIATDSHRQGDQVKPYKDTVKASLRRLQIDPANWEDLARNPPSWWRTVKTDTGICESNRITAAKAKRDDRKSQLPPPHNVNNQQPRPAHDASRRPGHQRDPHTRFTLVIDRRKSSWGTVQRIVKYLEQSFMRDHIQCAYLLKPQGLFQRLFLDRTTTTIQGDASFTIHILNEPKEFFHITSTLNIPEGLCGDFKFDFDSWHSFQLASLVYPLSHFLLVLV